MNPVARENGRSAGCWFKKHTLCSKRFDVAQSPANIPPQPATSSRPLYYTVRSVLCQTTKDPISQAFFSSVYPGQRLLQCHVGDLGVHLHQHGLKAASSSLITPLIFESLTQKCPFVNAMSDYLHLSWFQLTEGLLLTHVMQLRMFCMQGLSENV